LYYLSQIPLFFIFSIGILISLLQLNKNKKYSIISLVAFVLFLAHAIIMPYVNANLPLMLLDSGMAISKVGTQLMIGTRIRMIAGMM
jgi:predicted neutral ceramidase superfamily lipid hydrolase